MTYTVLARRYRSRTFDELVGQESIARTLRNAIASERSAHAYLFCGTRGVGKTSLARIFAAALNVNDDLEEAEAIREAVLRGDDLDVVEIDGASNRGINEARDLIAGAGLSPARSPYKIYIIDEVHMLTKEAFNALLKTMEEPPRHVKFILCTTDPMKVPATIQSRCQRFDFRAIPTPLIADQLRHIIDTEGLEAEDAVLREVARLGRGSMRDALSLLDRLIAAGEPQLTLEAAQRILGLPDHRLVETIVDRVADHDVAATLHAGAQLLDQGSTVDQALDLLAEHYRLLMVVAACGSETTLVDLTPEMIESAAAQAAHFDVTGLVHLIALCDQSARSARGATTARAIFDAALVRMCLSEHLADLAEVLAGRAPPEAPQKKRVAPVPDTVVEVKAAPAPEPSRAPAERSKARATVVPASPASPVPASSAPAARSAPTRDPEPGPAPGPVPGSAPGSAPGAAPGEPGPAPSAAVATATPVPAAVRSGEEIWSAVVATHTTPKDAALVSHLEYQGFADGELQLAVDAAGSNRARFLATQSERVVDLVQRATGQRVRVRIATPAPAASVKRTDARGDLVAAQRLPVVQKAIELFGAVVTSATTDEDTPDV